MYHSYNNEQNYVKRIADRGLSIYDLIDPSDPDYWIPTPELERLLNEGLTGLSLKDLPLRTRSKVLKQAVCKVLGYPLPTSFRKTKPRFPGQSFDTYAQKSNNLQIWNDDISPSRRYVIIRLDASDVIEKVKVVTGEILAQLDNTGTLTQKYQARIICGTESYELISPIDTDNLLPIINREKTVIFASTDPSSPPSPNKLLSIQIIFDLLKPLVGQTLIDIGRDQDRNRGAELHRRICEIMGYGNYHDAGQFPDIRNQLLEVKLQTSPTIDLGLVLPSSVEPLDLPRISNIQIRHCDIRYVIFYAETDGSTVNLTHLYLTTGEAFFTRFSQFQGKVINRKLQIPLPRDFFD